LQDHVTVKYRAYTNEGYVFDDAHFNKPIDFAVNSRSSGIAEALQFMEEGGKYQLSVPAHLLNGEKSIENITRPNEHVWFDYEIVAINRNKQPYTSEQQQQQEQKVVVVQEKEQQQQQQQEKQWQSTISGLVYQIIRKGNGKKPRLQDHVTVKYRAYTNEGYVFDDAHFNKPIDFAVNSRSSGIAEALQVMEEGGKYQLSVPANLLNEKSIENVTRSNEDVWFDYEIVSIKRNKQPYTPKHQQTATARTKSSSST